MPLPSYQFSGAVYAAPTVGTTTFNLTTSGGSAIGFLDPAHIKVYTTLDNGTTLVERFRPAQWEFNTARTQIILVVPTVANESVVVRRITPITGPYNVVPDGIVLSAQRLRDLNLYNLYVTQESFEASANALALADASNTAINLALSTIANQLPYVRYANRAAVPTNPGSAINAEVLDSTNMQTFTPLTGVPGGFIGSSSIVVRLTYNVGLVTWQWLDYRSANPDARYLLKTQLVNSTASTSVVDPPTANAVKLANDAAAAAQTTANTASTNANNAVTTANSAAATAALAAPLASPTFTGSPVLPQANGGQLAGFRNRIINGGTLVDNRGLGAPVTVTTATGYPIDRWLVGPVGASVTCQRFDAGGGDPDRYRLRTTGAASVSLIRVAQRIEGFNVDDMAGKTVTLSCRMRNTLLSSVTWRTFVPDAADVYTSATAGPTGTWTITSTMATYTATFTVPATAWRGFMIAFDVGAQTSGIWDITDVQLELGPVATPFEERGVMQELHFCLRYFERGEGRMDGYNLAGNSVAYTIPFKVGKRVVPTLGWTPAFTSNCSVADIRAATQEGALWFCTAAATAATIWLGTWTASAEL